MCLFDVGIIEIRLCQSGTKFLFSTAVDTARKGMVIKMKRKGASKAIKFLEEKGFYIILILCIAAVGVSGYVLFFSNSAEEEPLLRNPVSFTPTDPPVTHELQVSVPPAAVRETEVTMAPTATPVPTPAGGNEPDTTTSGDVGDKQPEDIDTVGQISEVNAGAEIPETQVKAGFYVWPVNGEVISGYSVDELVFNKTLEDWRVHTGADIAANLGTEVAAIGDGMVEDVYMSEMMGMTIVVDHGNGTRSVYQNLMETVNVEIGDTVSAGQTIGGIGQTADNESADSPHLHLEVIRDGAQVNPMELLP